MTLKNGVEALYAEKNLQSLDFPDPFQARRLAIVSAKSDFMSCRRGPRAATKSEWARKKLQT